MAFGDDRSAEDAALAPYHAIKRSVHLLTPAAAAAAAAVLGEISIIGLAGGRLPVAFGAVPWECPVSVPYWGTRPELAEVVALARTRRLTVRTEIFPLEEALTVYGKLRDGAVTGRAVLSPHD